VPSGIFSRDAPSPSEPPSATISHRRLHKIKANYEVAVTAAMPAIQTAVNSEADIGAATRVIANTIGTGTSFF
jgi:hypothetical protein